MLILSQIVNRIIYQRQILGLLDPTCPQIIIEMKKSVIWLLTLVIACIFMGFISVQLLYLKNLVQLRNEHFSEIVSHCLYAAATKLEENETKYYLEENLMFADLQIDKRLPGDTIRKDFSYSIPTADGNSQYVLTGKLNSIELKTTDQAKEDARRLQASTYKSQQEILKNQYFYQKGLLNQVVLNILSEAGTRPIEERADSATVKEILINEFANNGIDLGFEFELYSKNFGQIYSTPNYGKTSETTQVYSQDLFTNDIVNRGVVLKVAFPEKRKFVYSSITFLIISLLFSFILLSFFIYTIIVAFKQKKLSEMKNDFIHNMTHELKTPISSISLAAQMLNDENIRKSPMVLNQMSKVIGEEAKRLQLQVENVLTISLFDSQKAKLNLQEVDANNEIYKIFNIQKMKAQKLGGNIEANLDAIDAIVNVDKMHFTNIIFNLLDKALKYSKPDVPPILTVSTSNPDEDHLQIVIGDNGIGIKKEHLKRIFEKFYRVPTGNLHDVKGFGLGLAYVYKTVTELNGTITADSEFGKGSKFIITLPLYK